MFTGNMPDITPAQGLAVVVWIVGQALTLGVISGETSKLILGVSSTLVPIALGWYDAHIRKARNMAAAAKASGNQTANVVAAAPKPTA